MTGLSNEEVVKSREKYGSNEVVVKNKNTFFKLLLESLGDPMIRILLIVLAIKLVFLFADESWFETLGIFIAIFFATLLSTISEYGSNKAFNRLFKENNVKNVFFLLSKEIIPFIWRIDSSPICLKTLLEMPSSPFLLVFLIYTYFATNFPPLIL